MGSSRRRRDRSGRGRAAPRSARVLLLLGHVLTFSGCSALYELQSGYLYQPQRAPTATALPTSAEHWTRPVDGGEVHAFYLPPLDPTSEPAPAVVFAHGNRERAEQWAEPLEPYRRMGLAVLLPEYRGYAGAAGDPSESSILDDFVHFLDRLADRPDIDAQRIVFHGRSLGGGVVGALSTRRRCRALVLESTFTNVPDLASRWMAPMGAIRDRFDTRAALLTSSTRTLIVHGARDSVVPFRHAVELDRIAWDSQLLAFEAGHDDVPREATYWGHIRELLETTGVLRQDEVSDPPP